MAKDPFGPGFESMPIDALVGFMAADLVPHTWDMARTAKAVKSAPGADAQTKLLNFLGRSV